MFLYIFSYIQYNFSYKVNGGENTTTMEGSKSMCSNYRLVSLTPLVCKLLESLIRDVGFRPGYSCATQLRNVNEDFYIYGIAF